jgi:hypothetical protein
MKSLPYFSSPSKVYGEINVDCKKEPTFDTIKDMG